MSVGPRQSGVLALAGLALATAPGAAGGPSAPGPAVLIRVDPVLGRDGPASGPAATLGGALDRVAAIRARRPAAPITVELAPGTYRLARPVTIGPEHGGTAADPLVIRGAPGGATILSGSVALDPLADPLPPALAARLPAEARGHVRLYRLPPAALDRPTIQNLSLLRDRPATVALEVYDGQGALIPARWPNAGWAAVASGTTSSDAPGFTVEGGRPSRWRGEPDLWAEGYWRWNWLFEAMPVGTRAIDAAGTRVTLPHLPYEGILPGARFRVSHALSELDQPGEWWRDTARGLLVAWPREPGGRLDVAVAATLIEVAGTDHLRLDNLVLTHARGDLLAVTGARDVVVRHCALAWAAGRGAAFRAARDSGVEDCEVRGVGGTGVALEGGDRKTLTPGGLFVRGSRFEAFARLIPTQRAAVEVEGVGSTVEGNLFRDAGAPAMFFHGNDHRFAGNELTRLLAGIDDNGAIYAGRDWTARGNVIEGNYLHDIHADPGLQDKGILLDDMASGFTIRNNLFVRVDQPVFVGGGRDNVVASNVFVASSPAIHVDSRGETWAANAIADPESELRAAFLAMPTADPLWRRRYPGLAGTMADEPAVGKNNRLANNAFVLSEPFDFSDGGKRSRQIVQGNSGPDGIRSAAGRDLRALAAGSRDPADFGDLVNADGRPVGLVLARPVQVR